MLKQSATRKLFLLPQQHFPSLPLQPCITHERIPTMRNYLTGKPVSGALLGRDKLPKSGTVLTGEQHHILEPLGITGEILGQVYRK